MADDSILLNAETVAGGKSVATFLDAGGLEHEKVVAEYIDGTGQPQKVDATHGLPVNVIAGGGGGAVTIADGADVTEGAIADAIVAAGAAGTLSAKLRRISQGLEDLKTLITVLPLPTLASTSTLQTTGNTSLGNIDTKTPALGQALAAASTPVVLTAAEEAILNTLLTITDFDTKTGSLTETAPATDTASSGLNGRLQRIAQRLTSLIALLPAALGAGGGLKVDGSGTALPISGTVAVTGAGDASAANQTLQITQETAINTVMGLIADAAVAAGATGSISAKLRAISRDLIANIVLAAGANIIGKVGVDQTTPGTTNLVALSAETTKVIGTVNNATGSNIIGRVGIDQTTPGTTNAVVEASAAAILAKVTAAAASFVKLEDVASVDADAGVPAMAIRKATPANTSGTDGDYEMLQMSAGKLWVQAGATQKPSIGATFVMTVTNLQSLASSATAGWQSARVSNVPTTLANDYEIFVKLTTANTAPASDKAAYVFICPFYTTDAGTTWFASSQGTATLPTGTEGTTTIASPHNLRLLGVLNYTTAQMVLQDTFLLSNCFGNRLPDGFSIVVINFTGAALSTGCVVDYSPLNDILV